jgi:hypothetical protein
VKIRKNSWGGGRGETNSIGIQASYEAAIELNGFRAQEDKNKFSFPYATQGKELLRGNLNFSIKSESPILVFCRGEGLKGLVR